MSRISDSLHGFLIHDARICHANLDTTNTTATEADPQPGGTSIPGSATSRLVIEASGNQDADLDLYCTHGGFPGADQPGICYRENGEADAAYRGWNPPQWIERWEYVVGGPGAGKDMDYPHACVIPRSQDVVAVYTRTDADEQLYSSTWDHSANAWQTAISPTGNTTTAPGAIVALDDDSGRVLLFEPTNSSGTQWEIAAYITSTPTVAAWTMYSDQVLDSTFAATSWYKVRAIAVGDDVLLMMEIVRTATDRVLFWASSQLGTSFSEVLNSTCADLGDACEIVALRSGRVLVAYTSTVSNDLFCRVIGSVWESPANATEVTVSADGSFSRDVTGYCDWDGTVYLFARDGTDLSLVRAFRSLDEGATWTELSAPISFGGGGAYDVYVKNLAAVPTAGGCILLHSNESSAAANETKIGSFFLGGWSNVTGPISALIGGGARYTGRMSFGETGGADTCSVWVPIDLPDASDLPWTLTSAGAPTITQYDDRVNIAVAGGADRAYYTATPTGQDLLLLFYMDCNSGGGVASRSCHVGWLQVVGAAYYEGRINFSSTQFRIRDAVASTSLATITAASPVWILVCMRGAYLEVKYRLAGASFSAQWTEALEWQAMTAGVTVAEVQTIYVGCNAADAANFDLKLIAYNCVEASSAVTPPLNHGSSEVLGKALGVYPYPIWEANADGYTTFLRARRGPGVRAETHDLNAAHTFGLDRIDPVISPSPADVHRSTVLTTENIVWLPDTGYDTDLGHYSSIFLAVLRGNARYYYLEAEVQAGGGYTTLGTLDMATGMTALDATVEGDTVYATAGGANPTRYIWHNELRGAIVHFIAGGGYRKILRNTAGLWDDETTQGQILFDDADGTETTGTINIIHHSGILVIHNVGNRYEHWRVRRVGLTGTGTEEGVILMGAVRPIGKAHDQGWKWTLEGMASEAEDARGVIRRVRLGEERRSLTVSWSDDLAFIGDARDGVAKVDWLSAKANYDSLATYGDVHKLLEGIYNETNGGQVPVIYLLKIPDAASADYTVITDPSLWCYGHLVGPVTSTVPVGAEDDDEATRTSSITIRGIPG